MSTAIEFASVSAGYPGNPVLRDLSFRVAEGELAGILGPNGAGKTTLFRVLTGLLPAAAGAVRLFGRDIATVPPAERARLVGVVPQEFDTPMAFTVEEIVMIGRTASLSRWAAPSDRDRRLVERAMVQTDVADMKHRLLGELSGGEKQRAVVAMALAREPRIILMDEATSHLDMNHRLEIMEIVERLNRDEGVTVLLISHDLNLTADFCRRLLLLDGGRIAADGPPAEVLTEERLRPVYHCDVRVQRDARDGTISVIPARRLAPPRSGRGIRLHVIAGGGCGEELLRRLSLCGYDVSCGVLNEQDSDTETAAALEMKIAAEKPFSPVSAAALDAARRLASDAAAVIVSAVPFGPGNVANLALAEEALSRGRPVFLFAGAGGRDYTPNREAASRVAALVAGGAREFPDLTGLIGALPRAETLDQVTGGGIR